MKITITIDDEEKVPTLTGGISTLPYSYVHYDPCEHCSNNPKNNPNASGICCCCLPDMYKYKVTC